MKKLHLYKYLLLLTTLLFAVDLSSQAPGYMGKRLNVGYGFYVNPAFVASSAGFGENQFNTLHEGFLEYSTGKKFVLGVSGRFYKSTYVNVMKVDITPQAVYQVEDRPSGSYSLTCQNYALYGKAFKENYLAPWGKYFVFGLTLNRYQATYDAYEMKVRINPTVPGGQPYYSDFGYTVQAYKYVDILIGNGRTRVFDNRLTIDYGYNINMIAMTLTLVDIAQYDTFKSDEYIQKTAGARVRGINRFNFFCKIGYLF